MYKASKFDRKVSHQLDDLLRIVSATAPSGSQLAQHIDLMLTIRRDPNIELQGEDFPFPLRPTIRNRAVSVKQIIYSSSFIFRNFELKNFDTEELISKIYVCLLFNKRQSVPVIVDDLNKIKKLEHLSQEKNSLELKVLIEYIIGLFSILKKTIGEQLANTCKYCAKPIFKLNLCHEHLNEERSNAQWAIRKAFKNELLKCSSGISEILSQDNDIYNSLIAKNLNKNTFLEIINLLIPESKIKNDATGILKKSKDIDDFSRNFYVELFDDSDSEIKLTLLERGELSLPIIVFDLCKLLMLDKSEAVYKDYINMTSMPVVNKTSKEKSRIHKERVFLAKKHPEYFQSQFGISADEYLNGKSVPGDDSDHTPIQTAESIKTVQAETVIETVAVVVEEVPLSTAQSVSVSEEQPTPNEKAVSIDVNSPTNSATKSPDIDNNNDFSHEFIPHSIDPLQTNVFASEVRLATNDDVSKNNFRFRKNFKKQNRRR